MLNTAQITGEITECDSSGFWWIRCLGEVHGPLLLTNRFRATFGDRWLRWYVRSYYGNCCLTATLEDNFGPSSFAICVRTGDTSYPRVCDEGGHDC